MRPFIFAGEKMDIRVGAKLEKDKTTNMWVMNFENMSGDGDHYEQNIHMFKDPLTQEIRNSMLNIITLYSIEWGMGEDRYTEDLVIKEVKHVGEKLGITNPLDLYLDIVGQDVTCEDHMASPQEVWITYFNEYGDEYQTEITNSKKCFMGRINETNFKEFLNEYRHVLEDRA